MSMDGLGTPQDILATQTSDQRSHFLAYGWTAPFPSRFPAPPLEKGMLMPRENGLGFHQVGRRLPSAPHPGQQHPQEAKRRVKPGAGLSLLADTFFVCAEQHVVQEGSSPSGARMRSAISKSGGNSSLAGEGGRYGEAYTGTKAKAGNKPRRT